MAEGKHRRSRGSVTQAFGGSLLLMLSLLMLVTISAATNAAVYLEDSPAAIRLAEEAEQLKAEGRVGEAAQKLQQIIEQYPDKLMPTDATGFTDARLWARQQLGRDKSLREAYGGRFDALARRGFDDAKQQGLEAGEPGVRGVLERYALTPAGLDAALWLAGREVERGRGASAAATLAEVADHPDRGRRSAEYFALRAWAAGLSGQAAAAETYLRDVSALSPADPGLNQSVLELARVAGGVPAGTLEIVSPPPLDRPLWQVTIESSSSARVVAQPRAMQGAADNDFMLEPVASDGLLLINDNQRVIALDRLSGRLRWSYRQEEPELDPAMANARMFGGGRVIRDGRQVLVHRGAVVAVVGHAVPWQGRQRLQLIAPSQVVSLDAATGEAAWAVSPGDVEPALERAAFHGTPVAWGDQVIVMARRSQASSFQDSYLFSLDADTGKLRWRRHLASTAGPDSRNALSAMSSLRLVGSTAYFCDNLGAAAAVDVRSGTVRWVRVLAEEPMVDQRGRPSGVVLPFSADALPTLCNSGLVIPMRINDAYGLLLDPDTGVVLQEFRSAGPLAEAYELQPLDNGDLLVVGQSMSRLDGGSMEPRWSLPITPDRVEGVSPRVTLRGGVALVARGGQTIQEVDLETGVVRGEHTVAWNGRVMAADEAWVISSGPRLAGYLDWPVARAMLRQRAVEQPDSPEPGLNMAMLAINAGQPEAVDEGVNLALIALTSHVDLRHRDPAAWRAERSRVFRELLELTERIDAMEPASIERLFDRLATTTETPEELLAYNLGRGAYLESRGRLDEAAAFYQAVLLDPQQAEQTLERGPDTRRGDLAARQALIRLAETHGRGFYESFDRRAERELAGLLALPRSEAGDFLGLVRRYPLARVSARAMFAAAEKQAASTTHTGAATQYRRAFQMAEDDELRRAAAGSLTGYYQSHGRPAAAVRWLEQVTRDDPALRPLRAGQPTDAEVWLAELRQLPESRSELPGVSPPLAEAIRLDGPLVPLADESAGVTRPGGLLMFPAGRRDQLTFYDLNQHRARWTIPAPASGLRLVDQNADNLVLFAPQTGELHGVDSVTGKTLWPTVFARPLLEDLGRGGLREARAANAGQILEIIEADFGPINRERLAGNAAVEQAAALMVAAGESVVCVVDTKGRAFGLDRTTGRVLWQSALPVDLLQRVAVIDDVMAATGVVSPDTEAQAGRVLMVDMATGRLRFPAIEEIEPAAWLSFAPRGDLLVMTNSRVTLYDRRDGGARWRQPLGDWIGRPTVVAAGETVFIYDSQRLLALDVASGRWRTQGPNLLSRSAAAGSVMGADDVIYSLTPEGAGALDADLRVRWQDALADEPKRLLGQALGREHVAILYERSQPADPAQSAHGIALLERNTGRLVALTILPDPGPGASAARFEILRDHVMLAMPDHVLLIPGQPGDATSLP